MKTGKKDIVDGSENLIEGSVADQEVKMRITTWIDSDILQKLKKEADEKKQGYQTILNQKLRQIVLGEKDPLGERVSRLEKTVQQIKKRVG